MNLTAHLDKINIHIQHVWTYGYGQLLIGATLMTNLLQHERVSFWVIGFALTADLVWGIAAALKQGKFVLSKALRETFKKTIIYYSTLISLSLTERILHENSLIAVKIAAALAAACELWSMSASMLIVKPDMPFLKIFRLQLKGEIESKTGKNLDHILTDKTTNND